MEFVGITPEEYQARLNIISEGRPHLGALTRVFDRLTASPGVSPEHSLREASIKSVLYPEFEILGHVRNDFILVSARLSYMGFNPLNVSVQDRNGLEKPGVYGAILYISEYPGTDFSKFSDSQDGKPTPIQIEARAYNHVGIKMASDWLVLDLLSLGQHMKPTRMNFSSPMDTSENAPLLNRIFGIMQEEAAKLGT